MTEPEPTDAYERHRQRLREEGLDDLLEIIDLPNNRGFIASDGTFWIDGGDVRLRGDPEDGTKRVWAPGDTWD
ncbi:MAG TPA: hypothetical protein VHX66_12170 [Solirubrobacteraceae bacterium]|jgi:hypothetical protein|nr:hypothetical protein [Solirubrobacteraceae bacterium]